MPKPSSDISSTNLQTLAETIPGYDLLDLIGKGGFGIVYRACQASTGQIVALKLLQLSESLAPNERSRQIQRFEREAQLCAQLRHPHIVRLLDKGHTDQHQVYVVFEFVPGETLKEFLSHHGPISPQETSDLMGQVLDALASAHAHGVVHRDLKPHNIMITSSGPRRHATILDFGVAAFTPEARQHDYRTLTLTHEALGTPSYSAPEQLRGEPPTVKSDLYTWGLVFLECLTGKTVMRGGSLAEVFHKQLGSSEVALPPAIAGHPLADLLRRVLRKNPRDRAEQAERLYNDLRKIHVHNLVGDLQGVWPSTLDEEAPTGPLNYNPLISSSQRERRQVTVLCCNLRIFALGAAHPDLELLEALQRDQLNQLLDTSVKFGGHLIGSFGDSLMICFGYPHVSDNDARRAARTALDWMRQVQRRNPLLGTQHGIQLEIRVGLHTGVVLVYQDTTPNGITPQIAHRLLQLAPAGGVLVSETSRRVLEPYLEFDAAESHEIGDSQTPVNTHLLQAERLTEALTFLREGSTERPMIGRNDEFQQLHQIWQKTQQREGQVVVLMGEAGIGKSRLVHELRRSVRDQGGLTRACRCLPEHRNNALYPVLQMLQYHWGLPDISDPDAAIQRLHQVLEPCETPMELALPILCSWLSLPAPTSIAPLQHSPERQKQIFLDVLEQLIVSMGEGQPFLLIVEDLHWIDPTSLEFLERLFPTAIRNRIFLVHTTRPEFHPPWEAPAISLIDLQRLSPTATENLIQKVAGDQPVDPSTLDYLVQRTDGVPLFVEELVRMLVEENVLVLQEGRHTLAPSFDPNSIPVTLKDLLSENLNRLGVSKETAQVAAAIGREFDYELLLKASIRNEAAVQTDLETIVSAGLAYRQRRVQGEGYIFKHALIRDAAYDSMLRPDREHAHARIAETIETHFPEVAQTAPGTVAQHHASAGQFERALDYETNATRQSLGRSLNDEAIVNVKQGMEWLQNLPSPLPQKELELNEMETQALMAQNGWAAVIVKEKLERARELYDSLENSQPMNLFPTLWSLSLYNYAGVHRQEMKQTTQELLSVSEASNDSGLYASASLMHSLSYYSAGDYPNLAKALKKTNALYDPKEHLDHSLRFGIDTRSWALVTLGLALWFLGRPEEAHQAGQEGLDWAKELNHLPTICTGLLYRSLVLQYSGDKQQTAEVMEELLGLIEKYGQAAYQGYALLVHGWATNNPNLEQQQAIVQLLQQMRCHIALPYYASLSADVQAENGEYQLALNQINECIRLCDEYDERSYESELYLRRGKYLSALRPKGDAEVQQAFSKAIELAQAQGMVPTEAAARAALNS